MNVFWIITGPSCVGKSTFLEQNIRLSQITELGKPPIIHPPLHLPVTKTAYFHRCMALNCNFQFCKDIEIPVKIIILFAKKETIINRRNKRNEDKARGLPVPKTNGGKHLLKISWLDFYMRTINELDELEITYFLLNTEDPKYPIITIDQMRELIDE